MKSERGKLDVAIKQIENVDCYPRRVRCAPFRRPDSPMRISSFDRDLEMFRNPSLRPSPKSLDFRVRRTSFRAFRNELRLLKNS